MYAIRSYYEQRKFTAIRRLRRRKRLVAGIAAVLVIGIAAIIGPAYYAKSQAIASVAVLPFANLSGDASQEYYSDGMTEALINELGKIGALNVISRTSAIRITSYNVCYTKLLRYRLPVNRCQPVLHTTIEFQFRDQANEIRRESGSNFQCIRKNRDG